jgi:hypothetical protein
MDCTALTAVEQPALPAGLTATLELAADFAKASKAKATQDAYASDFRIFESWCRPRGLRALPATAESLCAFLADEASAGRRASTLGRRSAAIRYFHRAAGYDSPPADEKVKAVLSGIRRRCPKGRQHGQDRRPDTSRELGHDPRLPEIGGASVGRRRRRRYLGCPCRHDHHLRRGDRVMTHAERIYESPPST